MEGIRLLAGDRFRVVTCGMQSKKHHYPVEQPDGYRHPLDPAGLEELDGKRIVEQEIPLSARGIWSPIR